MRPAAFFRKLLLASLGATVIEYSILAALISIAALASLTVTGARVAAVFGRVSNTTGASAASAPLTGPLNGPGGAVDYSNAGLSATTWTFVSSGSFQGRPRVVYADGNGDQLYVDTNTDGSLYREFVTDPLGRMSYSETFTASGWDEQSNWSYAGNSTTNFTVLDRAYNGSSTVTQTYTDPGSTSSGYSSALGQVGRPAAIHAY